MKKIVKILFIIVVVLFLITFINRNNYYDNSNILSNNAIKQFEKDLQEGKNINPTNYIVKKKDYNNNLTRISLKISKIIETTFNKTLKKALKYIDS